MTSNTRALADSLEALECADCAAPIAATKLHLIAGGRAYCVSCWSEPTAHDTAYPRCSVAWHDMHDHPARLAADRLAAWSTVASGSVDPADYADPLSLYAALRLRVRARSQTCWANRTDDPDSARGHGGAHDAPEALTGSLSAPDDRISPPCPVPNDDAALSAAFEAIALRLSRLAPYAVAEHCQCDARAYFDVPDPAAALLADQLDALATVHEAARRAAGALAAWCEPCPDDDDD